MEESKIWSKRKAYILNLLNWKDFITFVAQSGREEFKNERFCCSLTSQARIEERDVDSTDLTTEERNHCVRQLVSRRREVHLRE